MSFSSLKNIKAAEGKPNVEVDLSAFSGEGAKVVFREPKAADLFPDGNLNMKIRFPEFPDAMLYQISLLAKCYVRQPDDPNELNLFNEFGNIARNNKDAFFHIISTFLSAFPTADLDDKVKEAKNE